MNEMWYKTHQILKDLRVSLRWRFKSKSSVLWSRVVLW